MKEKKWFMKKSEINDKMSNRKKTYQKFANEWVQKSWLHINGLDEE